MKSTIFFFSLIFFASSVYGQDFKLFNLIDENIPNYGSHVTISAEYAAVSNVNKNFPSDNASVFIYKQNNDNTWTETQVITENNTLGFGKRILLTDNSLFVSAFTDSTNGSVFVYKKINETFEYQSTIVPENSQQGDFFGYSLSFNKDNYQIAISAPVFNSKGAVFIFSSTSYSGEWQQEFRLEEDVTNYNCFYGNDVKYNGRNLLVGSPNEMYVDESNGRAYFYTFSDNQWSLTKTFLTQDHQENQNFGTSVDFDSSNIFISAPGFDNATGTVYLFRNDGDSYEQSAMIGNPNNNSGDFFGKQISLNGSYLLVSCINDFVEEISSLSGSCYVYKKDGGWENHQKLFPEIENANGLFFANSIAISDTTIIIGMPGNLRQHAYIYDLAKPFIIEHPINQDSINSNDVAKFFIKAERANSYIWQVSRDSGQTFVDLSVNMNFLQVSKDTLKILTDNFVSNDLYRCKVSNSYGYSISDAAKLSVILDNQVAKMYPNPNTGSFTIVIFDEYEGWEATVYDIRKQVIYSKTISSNETFVDLGKIQVGVYILSLTNGDKREYHKFITY